MLKLLEETVPVEQIWLDKADAPDDHGKPFEMMREKELIEVMVQVYSILRTDGYSPTEARRQILCVS